MTDNCPTIEQIADQTVMEIVSAWHIGVRPLLVFNREYDCTPLDSKALQSLDRR